MLRHHHPPPHRPHDPDHPDVHIVQVEDLYETPAFLWLPGVAGPKFNMTTRKVKISYSASSSHNHHHHHDGGGLA